jgi:hypothetical protein
MVYDAEVAPGMSYPSLSARVEEKLEVASERFHWYVYDKGVCEQDIEEVSAVYVVPTRYRPSLILLGEILGAFVHDEGALMMNRILGLLAPWTKPEKDSFAPLMIAPLSTARK